MTDNSRSMVESVTEFLASSLGEGRSEVRTSDFLSPFAEWLKVTFEQARLYLYEAVDAHRVEITSRYTLRLVSS